MRGVCASVSDFSVFGTHIFIAVNTTWLGKLHGVVTLLHHIL